MILEKERGEDEDDRADILIGFISNPQRWNMYVYVVNNPLAFSDPDGQKPRTINVFLDADTLSKEGLEEWQPIQIGLGSSAGTQNLLKLNFDYGTTDNTGNVKSQQIAVPAIGAAAAYTATQVYTYDSLNRIK